MSVTPRTVNSLVVSIVLMAVVCFDQATFTCASSPREFLGPEKFSLQPLWSGDGATSLLVAQDGSLLVFRASQNDQLYRSPDGGATWESPRMIGNGAAAGNALVDETNGDVLLLTIGQSTLYRSSDSGVTWSAQPASIGSDLFNHPGRQLTSVHSGITLLEGQFPGRLLMPIRSQGPQGADTPQWRPLHYASALFSDDRGVTWQASLPFPIMGTAEGAIAELSDGSLLYTAREQISLGGRYIAGSPINSGGLHWLYKTRSSELPDGPRGSPFGNNGALIRLPISGTDILLYSNVDSDGGQLPQQVGGTSTAGRERLTVWASLDGGNSWPIKRLVYDGPAGASHMATGRKGTASEGMIYVLFEGAASGWNSGVQIASFNLSWLLDGQNIYDYLVRLNTIYWTGKSDRWGGGPTSSEAWSSAPYTSSEFPTYTLADANGVSTGDSFNFVYDRSRLIGDNATLRMNRNEVEIKSLLLRGTGNQGMRFTNSDSNGTGLILSGDVVVIGGTHTFDFPPPGRSIRLAADNCWDIAEGSTLRFSNRLSGSFSVRKSGQGTLLVSGEQFHTGANVLEQGVFGAGSQAVILPGDLRVLNESKLLLNLSAPIIIGGNASFGSEFGISRMEGLSADTPAGRYPVLIGQVEKENLINIGVSQAWHLSPTKSAFFEDAEGLTVVVQDN